VEQANVVARRRWLSRRALLLHAEVLVIAPGCVAAGWWQATRALHGNGLSWFYSVEWPVFAILAVVGWWRLLHESPEAFRARKEKSPVEGGLHLAETAGAAAPPDAHGVDDRTARMAKGLAAGVGAEFVVGVVTLLLIRPSRPSGVIPSQWPSVYLVHAALGVLLAAGAIVLAVRVRDASRIARLSGWFGVVGVGVAGVGGLLTPPHALRLSGIVLMFIGTVVALFGYVFPTLEKLDRSGSELGSAIEERAVHDGLAP
jgi:hypothetical protein